MIKLIISNAGMKKIKSLGLRISQSRNLRLVTEHPQSNYGFGVILYAHTGDILDGVSFRTLRDNYGAVIVTDLFPKKITGALGLLETEDGIISGMSLEKYAQKIGISRQEMYRRATTDTSKKIIKIGNMWFIKKY